MDFFTVSTLTGRLLFVFVVLSHHRRRILHVTCTARPTSAWAAQQLVEAFPNDTAPRWLLRTATRFTNNAGSVDGRVYRAADEIDLSRGAVETANSDASRNALSGVQGNHVSACSASAIARNVLADWYEVARQNDFPPDDACGQVTRTSRTTGQALAATEV